MEYPELLRTTKIGNGFVKEDVLQYLDKLNEEIASLENKYKEVTGKQWHSEETTESTVLRTTKIGGGFVKEDVLQYVDELNLKIKLLERGIAGFGKNNESTKSELSVTDIDRYEAKIDFLMERLNASNKYLKAVMDENEKLRKKLFDIRQIIKGS